MVVGSRQWRSVLQRSLDSASEFADLAAQRLSAAADPRARLLRKRRWALRSGLFFAFACVFWVLVTLLLASWNTPAWALLIPGIIAAGAAAPATLLLLRYRWLRAEPLPSPRPVVAQRRDRRAEPDRELGGRDDVGHRHRRRVDGEGGGLEPVVAGVAATDHPRVRRAAESRRAAVQRDGRRCSAISLVGQQRAGVELADVAAAVP